MLGWRCGLLGRITFMGDSSSLGPTICVGPASEVEVEVDSMHIGRVNCRDEVLKRFCYGSSIAYVRMASHDRPDELIVSCE